MKEKREHWNFPATITAPRESAAECRWMRREPRRSRRTKKRPRANPRFARGRFFVSTIWCGGGESNPHGLLHKILSLARLPIPPPPRDTGHYTTRSICVKSLKQNPPRRSGETEQCKENIKLIVILFAEVELNREGTDDECRLLCQRNVEIDKIPQSLSREFHI